jgi:hypothetical protein
VSHFQLGGIYELAYGNCSLQSNKVTLNVFFLLINLLPTDALTLSTTKLATGQNPGDLILTFYYMQGKSKVT